MSQAPAYRIDGRTADPTEFYAVACDPGRSVVVEACAGAGKTWMLVSRVLRALLDGAQPQSILAITYTRKAAGEMRERLGDWLREFSATNCSGDKRVEELRLRGLSDGEARQLEPVLAGLHDRLLAGGRPVEIRTFHAWFAQLLRAAPLEMLAELGLSADVTLVEDWADHEAELYRRFHAAVLRDPSLLADFDAQVQLRGRNGLRQWLNTAWNKRVELELADRAGVLQDGVAPPGRLWPGFAALAHPSERLRAPVVDGSLRRLARALLAHTGLTARKQGQLLADALDLAEHGACLQAVHGALFTKSGELRKKLDVAGLDEAVAHLMDILAACAQHQAHEEHLRMVRLSRGLLAVCAEYKRSRRLADMSDLEQCALHLLRDAELAGWVQERLDARIRHVLIDEFQDTSPLQWHALHAWLSSYAGAGGGASGQRALSVFIVGDPKQSIYRFRRAEPRVFEAARQFVAEGLGGRVLACDHTRRNSPAVLDGVNAVFDGATRSGEMPGFRPHTTAARDGPGAGIRVLPRVTRPDPAPGAAKDDEEPWRDTLTVPRPWPEEALRQQEARWVALGIAELVQRQGVAPGDIKVLSRRRASLNRLSRELQALQLPHAAADERPLLDAIEVRDLLAVLDVLTSPRHRLSLAQALRSPIFGATDDDLIALARAARAAAGEAPGVRADWWTTLQRMDTASPALQRARRLLAHWHAAAAFLPPHDLLDRIVHQGEVHERVAAAAPASRRQAARDAIDALLAQALMLDGARYATPYSFVRALRKRALSIASPVQPSAVQLLTVHGAKGLEARAIFVMDTDPEQKNAETVTLLVDWPVDEAAPATCAFVHSESRCPPSLQSLLDRELKAREREELNGLYVAMTRAREQLVFSATQPFRQPATTTWWQRVEPLAGAWTPEPARSSAAADAPVLLHGLPVRTVMPSAVPVLEAPATFPGASSADGATALLGEAVHRVLEWATRLPRIDEGDLARLAAAAANDHPSDPAEVERLAGRMLRSPECARFFDPAALVWAGNEVPVSVQGQPGRIDRLVAIEHDGRTCWWVLDYKLHPAPHTVAAYRQQLLAYRSAVLLLQPDDSVQAAFLTSEGHCIPITPDS